MPLRNRGNLNIKAGPEFFQSSCWLLLELLQDRVDECAGNGPLKPTLFCFFDFFFFNLPTHLSNNAMTRSSFFFLGWFLSCQLFVDLSSGWRWWADNMCGGWNYPQSFTWPPIPLYCTHLVSTSGLISSRLNWAIERTLDLVIILYVALFPLSFLPFVCFLTLPFHTIWRKIRTESICASPPLISLTYTPSLIPFHLLCLWKKPCVYYKVRPWPWPSVAVWCVLVNITMSSFSHL